MQADTLSGDEELGTEEQSPDAMRDLKEAYEKEPEVLKLLENMDPQLTQFATLDKVLACLGRLRIVSQKYTHAYELDCMGKKYLKLKHKLNAIEDILRRSAGDDGGDFLISLRLHCCSALSEDEDLRGIMDGAVKKFPARNRHSEIIKSLNKMNNHQYLSRLAWMPSEMVEQLCKHLQRELPTLAAELSAWVQDVYLNDIWPKYKKFIAAQKQQ